MENTSVDDILNMKSSQLKEFLEDHHIPVPRRQSKEFLQTVALQTHADLEAESSKRQIITRRRSKKEETDPGTTYSSLYGRSSSSMPRSTPSRSSPSRSLSVTTRSRAQAHIKTEEASPDVGRQEQAEDQKEEAAFIEPVPADGDSLNDKKEGLSLLQAPTTQAGSQTTDDIPSSIYYTNPQLIDHAGERYVAAAAISFQQNHAADPPDQEFAENIGKLAIKAQPESLEMTAEPQVESIKGSETAMETESNKKQRRPNQEVVKKIIRVNDRDGQYQDRSTAKDPWILKRPSTAYNTKEGHHRKGHQQESDEGGQASTRMQRLKRSASMIMSQVNERVFKRLRRVSSFGLDNRPSLHVSLALLMCAICATVIGAASYWYHLKKLEEAHLRAQKRWLW